MENPLFFNGWFGGKTPLFLETSMYGSWWFQEDFGNIYSSLLLLMVEIRRSPVEVGSWKSHYLQGFIHPRWLFGISEPSTVLLKPNIESCNWAFGEFFLLSYWLCQVPGNDNISPTSWHVWVDDFLFLMVGYVREKKRHWHLKIDTCKKEIPIKNPSTFRVHVLVSWGERNDTNPK